MTEVQQQHDGEHDVNPRAAVFAMQRRHHETLKHSGLTKKVFLNSAMSDTLTFNDVARIQDGLHVVLGVSLKDGRALFLGVKGPSNQTVDGITTLMIPMGVRSMTDERIIPAAGYTEQDFSLVEGLFQEAVELQATTAPGYNLEQGTYRY